MKREIMYGKFTYTVVHICPKATYRHAFEKEMVYIKGEEEDKWKNISHKPYSGCKVNIINKQVIPICSLGYSLAKKDGSV